MLFKVLPSFFAFLAFLLLCACNKHEQIDAESYGGPNSVKLALESLKQAAVDATSLAMDPEQQRYLALGTCQLTRLDCETWSHADPDLVAHMKTILPTIAAEMHERAKRLKFDLVLSVTTRNKFQEEAENAAGISESDPGNGPVRIVPAAAMQFDQMLTSILHEVFHGTGSLGFLKDWDKLGRWYAEDAFQVGAILLHQLHAVALGKGGARFYAYGNSGIATPTLSVPIQSIAGAVRISPDRIAFVGTSHTGRNIVAWVMTQDGSLDESFGDHGTFTYDFGEDEVARGVQVVGNKILILVDSFWNAHRIGLVKLSFTGVLDMTVGGGTGIERMFDYNYGYVPSSGAYANCFTVTPTRIYIGFTAWRGSYWAGGILALKHDFSKDAAFKKGSQDGIAEIDFGAQIHWPSNLSVTSEGKVVFQGLYAGSNAEFGRENTFVGRVTSSGQEEAAFPTRQLNLGNIFRGFGIEPTADGFLVPGELNNGAVFRAALVRLDGSGNIVTSFGENGALVLGPSSQSASGGGLLKSTSGYLMMKDIDLNGGINRRVVSLTQALIPDPTFGDVGGLNIDAAGPATSSVPNAYNSGLFSLSEKKAVAFGVRNFAPYLVGFHAP